MANHESARTTGLYARRGDEISLDEVERIGIGAHWDLTTPVCLLCYGEKL